MEDWTGAPDPHRRGTGGPVRVSPVPLGQLGGAVVEGARTLGMPTFDSWNGAMMETSAGVGNSDTIVQEQGRQSIYRDCVHPWADRPNLTVLTHALVTRALLEDGRATGIELEHRGATVRVGAAPEVVLSLGAINTPEVLVQSGIGDAEHLRRFGIDVAAHLPAVGRDLQDHPLTLGGVWESPVPVSRTPVPRAGACVTTDAALAGPDIQLLQWEGALTGVTDARVQAPDDSWVVCSGLVRPASRGAVMLTGSRPSDPVDVDGGYLSDPRDVEALVSVVDARLSVHGVRGLRIADASVMPRITTGNTTAPCVIIGERASDVLRADLGIL